MSENYIDHWNANGQQYEIHDAGRGSPNGVATLDLNGRVPYSQLPESAVEFKGYWNASTNTPALADGTGTKGDMYYVDVAGIRDLGSGTQRFYVGDRVLYDGSIWKNMNPDLIDLFLPVGHLVWTSNANFNPNNQYPGTTWVQIKDRFILAQGDTYSTVNATGGAATVTLTTAQMPCHTHTFEGTEATSKNQSAHESFSWTGSHGHEANTSVITNAGAPDGGEDYSTANDPSHYGKMRYLTNSSVQIPSYAWTTNQSAGKQIAKDTSLTVSGPCTGNHNHKFTATGSNTLTGGNGTTAGNASAHNNMPPYIVKYCWERTA